MSIQPEILAALVGADAVDAFFQRTTGRNRVFVAEGRQGSIAGGRCSMRSSTSSIRSHCVTRASSRSSAMTGPDIWFPSRGSKRPNRTGAGLSVYLADVGPCFPDVQRMVRQLEFELGVNEGCARAGVFASPTNGGISCHYDSVDVFSIQLPRQ